MVTDVLLFLFFLFCFVFFLFTPLTSGLILTVFYLPFPTPLPFLPPLLPLPLPVLPLSVFVLLSQLEVLHYRLSVSSALHSPAQPSLQAFHAYQVLASPALFCVPPPCGMNPRAESVHW